MATHSSILAWKIPRTEELGRIQSMGSQRVGHNWTTSLGSHLGFFHETLWPPNVKNQPIRKDPDTGEDWRQEEKGTTEDEMVGWHHRLNRHEFRSWWRTGKPDVLQSMGSQRVRHNWATEKQWQCNFDIYFERLFFLHDRELVRSKGPIGCTGELELMARVQQRGHQFILMLVCKWWV